MITEIRWTIAEGNVFCDDTGQLDRELSLDNLRQEILLAMRAAYPDAVVYVERQNASGAVEELQAKSDAPDGYVEEDDLENIRAVADAVWARDWEVGK
jgi:hypothetical protein